MTPNELNERVQALLVAEGHDVEGAMCWKCWDQADREWQKSGRKGAIGDPYERLLHESKVRAREKALHDS